MADFVLVPGAWLGAWAWDEVAAELRAAGHRAYPVTLSGLAERSGVPAGLQTHVQDIVDEVERHDLRDVILVGHSYSGIPVGQAADRIGERLRRVVYVDSDVPVDGDGFATGSQEFADKLAANGGFWAPLAADGYEGHGLSPEQISAIVARSTPHPGASLTETAVLKRPAAELPATYIKCLLDGPEPYDVVAEAIKGGNWRLVTLDTGHWPMFSQPHELAEILIEAAAEG